MDLNKEWYVGGFRGKKWENFCNYIIISIYLYVCMYVYMVVTSGNL